MVLWSADRLAGVHHTLFSPDGLPSAAVHCRGVPSCEHREHDLARSDKVENGGERMDQELTSASMDGSNLLSATQRLLTCLFSPNRRGWRPVRLLLRVLSQCCNSSLKGNPFRGALSMLEYSSH